MTMTSHVSSVCSGLNLQLRNIIRIRRYLVFDTSSHTFFHLVSPWLRQCSSSRNKSQWCYKISTPSKLGWKLIYCATKYDHASLFLQQLRWMPVKKSITYKILLFVFKYTSPTYLSSLVTFPASVRGGLRSAADTTRLAVPQLKSRNLQSAALRTFFLTAPSM